MGQWMQIFPGHVAIYSICFIFIIPGHTEDILPVKVQLTFWPGFFTDGQNFWTQGRKGRAIYQLGRMLHLIQDIFIPHHAAVTARSGHGELEKWLANNWKPCLTEQGGYYTWEKTFNDVYTRIHTVSSKNPYDWIDMGSHISMPWYEGYFRDFKRVSSRNFFPQLASKIIPHTLRYSAGFINRFFVSLTL